MPLYEYICEDDGEILELLRPLRDADAPVEDPEGRGRTFHRTQSAFRVGASMKPASVPPFSGGCPCGNPDGPCST